MFYTHEELAKKICPYRNDYCLTGSCMMYVKVDDNLGACQISGMSGAVLANEVKRIAQEDQLQKAMEKAKEEK